MIKLFGINPFAEAMLYYSGRANNEQIGKRLEEAVKRCPDNKDALINAVKPALALEKLLSSKLTADEALVNKFFKKFDTLHTKPVFGFCIAHIIAFYPLISHPEYSTTEMCAYLRGCGSDERMFNFNIGLIDTGESVSEDENRTEEFLQRLENMQLNVNDKWKILHAAFDYQKHTDELISLIMPAAELIKNAENEYKAAEAEFSALYSRDTAQSLFESYFKHKLDPVNLMKVSPLIFGFDSICATVRKNDEDDFSEPIQTTEFSVEGDIFVGIARHLAGEASNNEVPALSKKMKALSDSTRLEILFYLCSHKVYGRELCVKFGLGHSAVSYHIAKLLDAGFLVPELVGTQTYYTADKESIRRMIAVFAEKIK